MNDDTPETKKQRLKSERNEARELAEEWRERAIVGEEFGCSELDPSYPGSYPFPWEVSK